VGTHNSFASGSFEWIGRAGELGVRKLNSATPPANPPVSALHSGGACSQIIVDVLSAMCDSLD